MLQTLTLFAILILAGIIWLIVWYLIQTRPRRKREFGFEFVYVEDDGNARELNEDEQVYLKTKFHGGDGNRPYIKFRYESLTPDGKLRGYLRRRQLPSDIKIKLAKEQK